MSETPSGSIRDRVEFQTRSAPVGRGDRGDRRKIEDGRNRRMFGNLQSNLGGNGATPLPGSARARASKMKNEPVESLEDLDTIIARISDITIRADRSASQIQRSIAHSQFIKGMNTESWQKLSDKLLESALDSGETDFIAELFITLLSYDGFQEIFPDKLMRLCTAYIFDTNDVSDRVPTFLGKILSTRWPRQYSKAIDTSNIVLYITVSIVKGWIMVLTDDTNAEKKLKEKSNVPSLPQDSDEEDEEEEEIEREDEIYVERCARALSSLCNSMQRTLWLQWPELVDEMYEAIKPTLTHNNRISGLVQYTLKTCNFSDVKTSLLQTYMSFHSWTKTKAVTTTCSSTQTI